MGKFTPYYSRDGIDLYLGDCREILPEITESINLLWTDPPYNVGKDYGVWNDAMPDNEYLDKLDRRCIGIEIN